MVSKEDKKMFQEALRTKQDSTNELKELIEVIAEEDLPEDAEEVAIVMGRRLIKERDYSVEEAAEEAIDRV